jgi:hypothetical protein
VAHNGNFSLPWEVRGKTGWKRFLGGKIFTLAIPK